MGIGNKLDDLLSERGMTVTELARRVDVAPTTIYSIIQRNNKKVDIDVLIKIARTLGVNTEYFGDVETNSPRPSWMISGPTLNLLRTDVIAINKELTE